MVWVRMSVKHKKHLCGCRKICSSRLPCQFCISKVCDMYQQSIWICLWLNCLNKKQKYQKGGDGFLTQLMSTASDHCDQIRFIIYSPKNKTKWKSSAEIGWEPFNKQKAWLSKWQSWLLINKRSHKLIPTNIVQQLIPKCTDWMWVVKDK